MSSPVSGEGTGGDMIICPKCENPVESSAFECPYCGVILSKVKADPAGDLAPPMDPGPENVYSAPESAFAESQVLLGGSIEGAVTQATLDALRKGRPWMRLLVGYGFVIAAFVLVAAVAVLAVGVVSQDNEAVGATAGLGLAYLLYFGLILWLTLPLLRASGAVRKIETHGVAQGLEHYAVQLASLWRRAGILVLIGLILIGLVILLAGAGALFAVLG